LIAPATDDEGTQSDDVYKERSHPFSEIDRLVGGAVPAEYYHLARDVCPEANDRII
jgi:hypothetical protein